MATFLLPQFLTALVSAGPGLFASARCDTTGAGSSVAPPLLNVQPGLRRFGTLILDAGAEEFRSYRGLEYPAPKGTEVRAAADGIVFYARINGALKTNGAIGEGYGRLIKIRHACGVTTRYAHLRHFLVREGTVVRKGQVIAISGNSGGSHQPHLHFEVLVGGRPVDPALAIGTELGSLAWVFQAPLKEPVMSAPVVGVRINSKFGKRFHPIHKRYALHQGVDYPVVTGTPIRAVADGVVYYTRVSGALASEGKPGRGYGRLVKIRHDHGITTRYAHLHKFLVKRGQKVKKGDVIGLSGNTGGSTGPHLHFEVRVDGRAIDPLEAMGQPLSAIARRYEASPEGETKSPRTRAQSQVNS